MSSTSHDLEHSDMVQALAKRGHQILETLTPNAADLWHAATGCATEAGELLDAAKKVAIYNKPVDRENVVEELGDLEFYMQQVRLNMGISRAETLVHNMAKLAKRYPNYQYTDQRAHDRADKQG